MTDYIVNIVTVTGSNISLTMPIQDAIYNVTIHVYIHISVYSTSLSATREPEVKRRWIRLLEYIIGTFFCHPYGWISIPETRLDSIEYSFPVALTDGSHFVNIVDVLTSY